MSIPYVVDGETELSSELFNPWVDQMNGLQTGALPIALAGIEGALGEYAASDSTPVETVIYDHIYSRSADASTNRTNLQTLLDRIKPTGSGKQVRLFIPPKFASGLPDPMMVNKGSGAFCMDMPSGVSIEGAGIGSALKLAAGQPSSTRVLSISGKSNVRVRGLSIDGNKAQNDTAFEQNHCIMVYESEYVSIDQCELKNATGDGVMLSGTIATPSAYCTVERCDISENYRSGVTVTQADNIRVLHCDIVASSVPTSGAFDMEPYLSESPSNVLVHGNNLSTPDTSGYLATLAGDSNSYPYRNIRFSGNHLSGGLLNIICSQGVLVEGNTGDLRQVYCNGWSRDVVIRGNSFRLYPVDGRGVYLVYSGSAWPERVQIAGNTLEMGAAGDGIVLRGADKVSAVGNTLLGYGSGAAVLVLATRDMADISVDGNVASSWERFFQGSVSGGSVIRRASVTNNAGSGFSHASYGAVDLATTFGTAVMIDPIVYGNRFGSVTSGKQVSTNTATPYVVSGNPGAGAAWNVYGSPEGQITEVVGATATRRDGGASTTMYVKESGTGNTGWRAV
jgi:hypothetical protein